MSFMTQRAHAFVSEALLIAPTLELRSLHLEM